MSTAERLTALRRTNPILFWVWRRTLALLARCGWRAARDLNQIVRDGR